MVCSLVLLFAGCSSGVHITSDAALRNEAAELADEALIIDTHIDLPYRLHNSWADISQRTDDGDFDYPRAVAGGLDALFVAIYTPHSAEASGKAFCLADSLLDLVQEVVRRWPHKFSIVSSPADVASEPEEGKVLFCIGMENGAPIQGNLENLRHFQSRGVRYVTLCHVRDNHICDSSNDTSRTWHGLSPFGRELVREMNRLGVMIDVSHASDETVEQVLQLSKVPVIASHSGCRAFTPGFNRNLPDSLILRIAERGGVIHVGFGSYFLSNEFRAFADSEDVEIGRHLKTDKWHFRDPAVKAFLREYWKTHSAEKQHGTAWDVARHIDHIIKLAGVDHVGLGSDFEGSGNSLPVNLKDVSEYPNLIYELLKLEYSHREIRKICGGNTLRVWHAVESTGEGR